MARASRHLCICITNLRLLSLGCPLPAQGAAESRMVRRDLKFCLTNISVRGGRVIQSSSGRHDRPPFEVFRVKGSRYTLSHRVQRRAAEQVRPADRISSMAGGLILLGRMDNRVIQVIEGRQDLLGLGECRGHRPALETVVADPHHARVAGLVVVDQGIRVEEAQPVM